MRMRFNAREKEMLAAGERNIEISYGSGQWIAFTLDDTTTEKCKITDTWQTSLGTVTTDTNTKGQKSRVISRGWRMRGTPGNIRPVGSDWKVT